MRSHLSISLSISLLRRINQITKSRGFSSRSDFIRHAVQSWIDTNSSGEELDIIEDPPLGFGLPLDVIKALDEKIKNEN